MEYEGKRMKIFTEKALEKYVEEKMRRIRERENYVRDMDRLNAEHYKLVERVEALEQLSSQAYMVVNNLDK